MAKKQKQVAEASGELVTVGVECPVFDSFRVSQVAGMFDVPLATRASESFAVELPRDEEAWQIGVVVGPSGSGKSTISRHRWGAALYAGGDWPSDRAVIDCFGECDVKTISAMLTSVGFSSPPSWVKPYGVLSNGEKFRCDLARSLIQEPGARSQGTENTSVPASRIVVFDEFTSVVDRTVAKIGSAAVSKVVRKQAGLRFVAVSCHYDIVEWLEPDWVLDMGTRQLIRRRLRRPRIELELYEADRNAWELFKKAHYLSASIPNAGKVFVATWNGEPVGCVVTCVAFTRVKRGVRGMRRISRIVVLPDFQGVGIGRAMGGAVAQWLADQGYHVAIVTAHPSMMAILRSDPRWRVKRVQKFGNKTVHVNQAKASAKYRDSSKREFKPSFGRALVSAEWVAPASVPA